MLIAMRHFMPFSRTFIALGLVALTFSSASGAILAQQDEDAAPSYSDTELEELVGPVALYPDDLLAIVLPASTYPLQIVQAARYLENRRRDPSLAPDEDWDDAVVALLNYPEVIEMMNRDLDWTWQLGEAVVNQQPAVIDAIQDFRGRAYAAGNLKSDEHQVVERVDEVIEIDPVEPDVIYVPRYEPRRVIVYQSVPVYDYYPYARPVYYYPYPAGYSFASGFFWGVSTAYVVSWLTDGLHSYHYGHASHPYYGHSYYRRHYVRHTVYGYGGRHITGGKYTARGSGAWRPGYRHGARPRHLKRARQVRVEKTKNRRRGATASHYDPPRYGKNTSSRRMADRRKAGRVRYTPKRRSAQRVTRQSRDVRSRAGTRVAMRNPSRNQARNKLRSRSRAAPGNRGRSDIGRDRSPRSRADPRTTDRGTDRRFKNRGGKPSASAGRRWGRSASRRGADERPRSQRGHSGKTTRR